MLIPIKAGFKKSLALLWLFFKVILPVTMALTLLEHLGWVERAAGGFAPFMRLLGLPGEAAIPMFLGFFVNFYAAIGGILALSLTPAEITILGVILLISHSLFIETAICRHAGFHWGAAFSLRIGTALAAGGFLHLAYLVVGRLNP